MTAAEFAQKLLGKIEDEREHWERVRSLVLDLTAQLGVATQAGEYQPALGDLVIALMCPEYGPGKVVEILTCDGAKVEWPDGTTGAFVSERLELFQAACNAN